MPTTLKTRGIIIAEEPFGDYGLFIICYTKDAGLITARGTGIKKINAKLRSSVLPGNISYLTLIKQNGWHITGAKVIEGTALKLVDNIKFALTSAVREAVKTIIPEEVYDKAVYELLEGYILFMSRKEILAPTQKVATYRTVIRLLGSQGFAVLPDRCAHCGKKLTRNEIITYGKKKGFLCALCVKHLNISEKLYVVSHPLLSYLSNVKGKIALKRPLNWNDIDIFSSIVSGMYEVASERKLHSLYHV